ncbi:cation efflux family-domain-containing protein [Lipomyces tetrasporus]|uniref:Zinc transporter n=1 Tax=Lipomyces tetrasporus TaxID=54092 RepID=A0AAD7QTF7_9ASCO|nr:cation efflux family-domain-containing protein [Lipomyces tetrasporus]KAJ8101194.1 cation efflux family-domain-containing protein [Lipomyces tetrasporus]
MLGVNAPANTLNAFDFDGVTLDDGDGSNTATEKTTEQNGQPMPVNVTPPRSTSPVKVPRKPFNFQSTVASRSPVNKPNQRRGHKYKHSSVSMNFFLEPPPRPPPVVPAHFPVPTHKDAIQSMSRDQKIQLGWCSLHFLVGLQLWFISSESTVLMALSHIIFYDAFAATLSVLVDVLSNFEVWKNSSIRHPFGLQRAEILAGFASTVGLLFMGIDIGSHLCENFMKHVITESSPHDHESERFYARGTPIVVIFSIMATVVSSIVFKNHERIGTAVQFSYIRKLKYGLNNPLYLTTLSSCLVILSLPLWTSEPWYSTIDNVLAIVIAFAMCFVGWMTAITLGRMLLMGFSGRCAQMILNEIQGDSEVKSVEDSRMWQVHYGLFIINIKLRLHGSTADETRVRANVNRIIGDVLKANLGAETMANSKSPGFTTSVNGSPTVNAVKFRGKTGIQWESTIDIDRS